MNENFLKYGLLFVVMVLLQEFVFNNIQLSTFVVPYVYILPILILPFSVPPLVVILASFALGLSVDFFCTESLGVHASACLTMAYMRKLIFSRVLAKNDEDVISPTIYNLGWRHYIAYTVVLVLVHHSMLFLLESFKFENIHFTLLRILLSTVVSVLFITLFQLAFFKQKKH